MKSNANCITTEILIRALAIVLVLVFILIIILIFVVAFIVHVIAHGRYISTAWQPPGIMTGPKANTHTMCMCA